MGCCVGSVLGWAVAGRLKKHVFNSFVRRKLAIPPGTVAFAGVMELLDDFGWVLCADGLSFKLRL